MASSDTVSPRILVEVIVPQLNTLNTRNDGSKKVAEPKKGLTTKKSPRQPFSSFEPRSPLKSDIKVLRLRLSVMQRLPSVAAVMLENAAVECARENMISLSEKNPDGSILEKSLFMQSQFAICSALAVVPVVRQL